MGAARKFADFLEEEFSADCERGMRGRNDSPFSVDVGNGLRNALDYTSYKPGILGDRDKVPPLLGLTDSDSPFSVDVGNGLRKRGEYVRQANAAVVSNELPVSGRVSEASVPIPAVRSVVCSKCGEEMAFGFDGVGDDTAVAAYPRCECRVYDAVEEVFAPETAPDGLSAERPGWVPEAVSGGCAGDGVPRGQLRLVRKSDL